MYGLTPPNMTEADAWMRACGNLRQQVYSLNSKKTPNK